MSRNGLLAQLDGLAAHRPVLLVFEDAHWIDPTSLELLERTIDRVHGLPVLLIVTARPEFAPPWAGRPHVTVHPLNRLSRRDAAALIGRVTGGRDLPREVEDQLWARFKGAQDVFFTARTAQFAEQDSELRGNQVLKEAILAEGEALDPAQKDSTKRLRELQERWEAAGKVPRDVVRTLEDRMGKVEERFRQASDTRPTQRTESTFVVRLREKVAELEGKLERARAGGRPTEELEASLETQRQWLSQAGAPAQPSRSAPEQASGRRSRSTTAWVRSD